MFGKGQEDDGVLTQVALNGEGDDWAKEDVERKGPAAAQKVLAKLKALTNPGGDHQWEGELDLETLRDLHTAIKAGNLNDEIHPGLNSEILERAKDAFRKFINYVPALYLASPSDYESLLGEIFSDALQMADQEAHFGLVSVLLRMVDHRLLRSFHDEFVQKTVPGHDKKSAFRVAVAKWYTESKDQVHNKKATFPIMEALEARRIEIATVEQSLKAGGPPFHDDDLIDVVNRVCADSKHHYSPGPFGIFNELDLKINGAGGFNHVREKLIEINDQRKVGKLSAHSYTDFDKVLSTKEDLLQFVKILMIAHGKLYTQLEESQLNLSQVFCSNLETERQKNVAFQKLVRDLTRRLEEALANNAQISPLKNEILSLKGQMQKLELQIIGLTAQVAKEKKARVEAEKEMELLHSQYQTQIVGLKQAHVAELNEVRRGAEAALEEERSRSKVALEQQRLRFEALLAEQKTLSRALPQPQGIVDNSEFSTPKRASSPLVDGKSPFFDTSTGRLTKATAESDSPHKPFAMTFSPGGSDVNQ